MHDVERLALKTRNNINQGHAMQNLSVHTQAHQRGQATEHKLQLRLQAARDMGYEGEQAGVFRLRSRQCAPSKHSIHRAMFRRHHQER
jgi:hypothetical protein